LLGEKTEIWAEAETDVEFLVVPQDVANKWLVENDEWREVLLRDFFSGWNESMAMLDQVAFKPLQRRLEKYLAEHQGLSKRNIVHKSHAEIAAELNVSREAVSRVLKVMENQDDIHLGHGSIKVIHSKP
jgi:CRP/FNR family transcriptional regulator